VSWSFPSGWTAATLVLVIWPRRSNCVRRCSPRSTRSPRSSGRSCCSATSTTAARTRSPPSWASPPARSKRRLPSDGAATYACCRQWPLSRPPGWAPSGFVVPDLDEDMLRELTRRSTEDLQQSVIPRQPPTLRHAPKQLRKLSHRASTRRPWGGQSADRRRRAAVLRRRARSRPGSGRRAGSPGGDITAANVIVGRPADTFVGVLPLIPWANCRFSWAFSRPLASGLPPVGAKSPGWPVTCRQRHERLLHQMQWAPARQRSGGAESLVRATYSKVQYSPVTPITDGDIAPWASAEGTPTEVRADVHSWRSLRPCRAAGDR
jgi:hypothetical protein